MNSKNYTQAELEQLIERYFSGLTSVAEERELRAMLTQQRYSSPAIDEACAVMGFFVTAGRKRSSQTIPGRFAPWAKMASVAAVVAIVMTMCAVSWYVGLRGQLDKPGAGEFMAYAGGRVITDPDEVSQLAEMQILSVMEASRQLKAEVEADLQSMSIAFGADE